MPLPILNLRPDSSSYKVDRGSSVLSTKLQGGAGRYRKDQLGASSSVPLTFTLDPLQYTYLMSFFRTTLEEGSLPFQIDLISETGFIEAYKAYFMSGQGQSGISLISAVGLTYIVGATLEVVPISPPSSDFDLALVALYGSYTDGSYAILAALQALVNTYLPTI
jgi:hypothetical protein